MKFKFFMKKAPLAVKNFVTLASNGYFDGQIFHRVINDFMIQGGIRQEQVQGRKYLGRRVQE
ncbi:MAG: peptidylprolyl isomerase [Anaerostipes hadrus]